MSMEPVLAFITERVEPPGLEVRVNFGIFAGREATPAELDDLGDLLLDQVREVSVIAEDRHEMGAHSEAALHQVRVEVEGTNLPADRADLAALGERLVGLADRWARACIAERHVEVDR